MYKMMRNSTSLSRLTLSFSHLKNSRRKISTLTLSDGKSEEAFDAEWRSAKPYELIPGPKPLPLVGNILRFLPVIGEYWNQPLGRMVDLLRQKYGDVVKLEGIPGRRRCVFLFDPNHCEKVYRTEGPWPCRISMETMQLYREKRKDIYKGEYGLVSSQGKEWHQFRSRVNQHLMQPRTIRPHIEPIDQVASDFIDKIRVLRDSETLELPGSFNNEMNKWALESMCVITFDHRVGCLEPNLPADSEPQLLINNVHDMFDLMYKLEILPSLWKVYETRNLKKFFKVMDSLTRITGKYVQQGKERLADKSADDIGERSVLEKLISVDEQTTTVMIMDMLTAGVDTTSNTTSGAMYYVATNPEVQEKLRNEASRVLPSKSSPVTMDVLNNTPYLKAVIKESMRMMPIAVGNLRTTTSDVVIGGYRIPKGDDVIMCHSTMSLDAKHFPDEMRFLPERWLKESSESSISAKNAHPFVYMPFGFGPRTCIGRRFAQLEMETLLIKLIRNFRLEWHHGPLEVKSGFINTVGSPLRLKIIDV